MFNSLFFRPETSYHKMSGSKKIIRKTDSQRLADFDDQIWPVNCAIMILAGLVSGIALATGNFSSSDPLENTTLRLLLIAITTVLLLAGSFWLDGRLVRRLQLCVLISLMVHLGLGIYLHQRYITLMAVLEADKPVQELVEDDARLVVPEYHWQRIERPLSRPSFEQPTKTEATRAADPEPVEQQQIEHAIRSKKPEVKPDTPQPQQPKPAEMRRAELTAPRRAKLAAGAQISRQQWKQQPQPNEPVAQPKLPEARRAAALQQNQVAPLERKATKSPRQQRQVFDVEPADRKTRESVKLARRATERQLPEQTPSTRTPSRIISRQADLTQEQIAMPAPIRARADSRPKSIVATNTSSVARTTTAMKLSAASNTTAEFSVTAAPIAAAQPAAKATDVGRPSLSGGGSNASVGRSSTPSASQLAAGLPVGLVAAGALAAMPAVQQSDGSSGGSSRQLTQNTKATTMARGGATATPGRRRAVGAGPMGGSPSAADRIGVARRARVARNESLSTGISAGGGSFSQASMPGRALAKVSTAELPQIAAVGDGVGPISGEARAKTSAGRSSGRLQAGHDTAVRQATATAPISRKGTPGATSTDLSSTALAFSGGAGPASTSGLISGPRRFAQGEETGPALAAEVGGGPLRKNIAPGLLPGIAETIEPVAIALDGSDDAAASDRPRTMDLAAGLTDAPSRRASGGLPVRIAAAAGPGGLSYEPSPEIGIPTRRARPESQVVHTMARRFLVERSGGRLPVDASVQELATEAFRQRDPGKRARAVEVYGGSEGTEQAVELGLEFFVRHQLPDGCWSLDRHKQKGKAYENAGWTNTSSDTAATGLALLSFFGAGYTHQTDKHRDTVRRGIDWLVKSQKENGDLFTGGTGYTWFYSHGIATIALCEAYGMTNDADLREPAQRAVAFIVESQHPQRGGWRYKPQVESDTSVSGWQLMALKSAQMAGLDVPAQTLEKVSNWLDTAQAGDGSRFVYNPNAPDTPDQRAGRRPNLAMTAEGTLMRMYLGRKNDDPVTIAAADHLAENLPEVGSRQRPTRDAYYWYYATQVMFHLQGEHWKTWNARLRPLLEKGQQQDGPLAGSWNPSAPVPDRWGHAGGRMYLTALNLLMLEVYYRHLPLFQTLEE